MARKKQKKVEPLKYLRYPDRFRKEYRVCVEVITTGWVDAWDEVQEKLPEGKVIWVEET